MYIINIFIKIIIIIDRAWEMPNYLYCSEIVCDLIETIKKLFRLNLAKLNEMYSLSCIT